jgi:ABC-type transport system involved in multi-copper enzyme maturation permease subunit
MQPLGSVFTLEWQAHARRPRFFWLRIAYAGLVLIALGDVLAPELARSRGVLTAERFANVAGSFFWAFSFVQLLTVLLLTPAITAGTLADDSERGVLESLLVTDLTRVEIVLGKLCARLLLMVSVLAAGVPMLALCVWLGRVGTESLLAVLSLTAITLLAVGGVTLWVSIHSPSGRDALQVVYVAGIIVGLFPPLFALSPLPWPGGAVGTGLRLLDNGLIAPNPLFWLVRSWQTGSIDWQQWNIVVLVNGAIGLAFTLLAVFQVRHALRREASAVSHGRILKPLRPQIGDRPILWKELFTNSRRYGLGRLIRVCMTVVGWGALLWMLWALAISDMGAAPGQRTPFRTFVTIVEPPLVCIALLGIVLRAATSIAGERERGTWDSVLLTPQSAGALLWSKLLGCLFAVRWIGLLVLILWTIGVLTGQLRPAALGLAMLLGVVVSVCAAIVGMAASLRCRSALRSVLVSTSISLFLSGGYLLLILPFLLSWLAGRDPPGFVLAPCIPVLFVVSMVYGATDPADTSGMLSVCFTGAGIYAAAGLGLLVLVRRRFDRWAGRTYSLARK